MSIAVQAPQLSETSAGRIDRSKQNGSYEILRFVAALGVVWFHCHAPLELLGYAGLPALVALSLGLATAPGRPYPFSVTLSKRARRLLLPWVFWCIVYGLGKIFKSIAIGEPVSDRVTEWIFMAGPALHLWYLPYAFAVTCLGGLARRSYNPSSEFVIVLLSVASVVLTTVICSWVLETTSLPAPFSQWIYAFPAVVIGCCLPHSDNNSSKILSVLCLLSAVIVACLSTRSASFSTPYIAGIAAVGAAWLTHVPATTFVKWLGGLSFGIYLVHPITESILITLTSYKNDSALALLVIAVSILLTAGLQRTPFKVVL